MFGASSSGWSPPHTRIHPHTLPHSPSPILPLPLKAIDPHSVRDKCLQPLIQSLREPVVKFVASGLPLEGCGLITVDLELDDISWLNSLNRVAISCVCVVWNLDSPLVSGLQTIPRCGLLKVAPSRVSLCFHSFQLFTVESLLITYQPHHVYLASSEPDLCSGLH